MQGYFSPATISLRGTKHLEDGGMAMVWYITVLFATTIILRALRKRKVYLPFIIGGSLELFVRGMGLFTLNLILLCLREE